MPDFPRRCVRFDSVPMIATNLAWRFVSVPETRRLLGGIGNTTVYELFNCGEIVKVNIGRRGFITSQSLEAYMDRLNAASVGVTQREKQPPRADHPCTLG